MTTMDDRTLIERAAKAAGIEIDKSPYNGGGLRNTGFDLCGNAVLDWHNYKTWNPLTDDGDALRLAVKLNFDVDVCRETGTVWAGVGCGEALEQLGADPYAATRRAIVRAAASLAMGE
jgi:hypothetical protein